MENKDFMMQAIKEGRKGITRGHGGPFGAVIVKDGKVIARAHNTVLHDHNPTAHGEINVIRIAGQRLGTHNLSGCDLYTTGEPCHMCLCACLWANIRRVYYGCTIIDNSLIGFRDGNFDKMFGGREALGDYLVRIEREECLKLFGEYNEIKHTTY